MSDIWEQYDYFPSSVYILKKPEFLKNVSEVANLYLQDAQNTQKLNELHPVYQSANMIGDENILEFSSYVLNTSWNILDSQGYDMSSKQTYFTEMWLQTHYKFSLMERHVHPGSYLVGFYFIETPKDCSVPMIHDPRSGKVMTDLPQKNMELVTYATDTVHYKPEPGMLIFANSWLPHSFSKHGSLNPIKFIHFNISAKDYFVPPQTGAIVI